MLVGEYLSYALACERSSVLMARIWVVRTEAVSNSLKKSPLWLFSLIG